MDSFCSAETVYGAALECFANDSFFDADALTTGLVDRALTGCVTKTYGYQSDRDFSVIVVSHRTTPKFLDGIKALADARLELNDAEFIFVSNGHDGLESILLERMSPFTLVEVGFNFGCSGGRNIGARIARGSTIVFVDDDGITTADSIRALASALVENKRLVAVRGQAIPFPGQDTPRHYKPAERALPRFIDLEGISAWRRDVFNQAGGFNVLLAGHEGIDLTARIVRTHGYDAFRYEPAAILQHDYAPDSTGLDAKRERQARGKRYLEGRGFKTSAFVSVFERIRLDPFQTSVFQIATSTRTFGRERSMMRVCFLTTVKNGEKFVANHHRSLVNQTDQDFELVVIDDNSNDESLTSLERCWGGDPRAKIIKNTGSGRADALNCGIEATSADILLISDIDDYSYPQRVAETKRAFVDDPQQDLVGFLISDEKNYVRLGRPSITGVTSLSVRRLFGMPAPFPALAFRRGCATLEKFDPNLVAASDYDWISRVLKRSLTKGKLIFNPMVYYYTHDGQITHRHADEQRATGEQLIVSAYEDLIDGNLTENDKKSALRLAGWLPCSSDAQLKEIEALATETISANASKRRLPQEQLEIAIMFAVARSTKVYLNSEVSRLRKQIARPESVKILVT